MNKYFVNYDIALQLKEIGFDEPCLAGYQPSQYGIDAGKMILFFKGSYSKSVSRDANVYGPYCRQNNHVVKAPLYQQVFDWFRQKGYNHTIIVENREYGYHCGKDETDCISGKIGFENYDEAQNECIKDLIQQLNNE